MIIARRFILPSLLAVALLGLPLLPQPTLDPMSVSEHRVALAFAAEDGADGEWVSAPLAQDATVVGLTWDDPQDAPEGVEIRVATDGDWADWQQVEVDDEHAPDPRSPESSGERGGTAPIVVEGAEAVQFRVAGDDAPEEVTAEIIEVDDPAGVRRIEGRDSEAEAAPGRPRINGRGAWNADSCVRRDADDIDYVDRVEVLFVHHTAGRNAYGRGDVAGIVRGICSYHVNGRGWDDIGYNALIDRYGGIWEGRAGGLERGVQGAHTGGFNSYSTGVAFIGEFTSDRPPTSARDALRRYAAWKLDVHNVDPRGSSVLRSKGSSRWRAGTDVRFDAISGHRDASWTSCPGSSCYALLDEFIDGVASTGGLKIFGGHPRSVLTSPAGTGWETTTIDLSFNERARWRTQVRDASGRTVWSTSGTGRSATVRWDGRRSGGGPVAPGRYTIRTTATSTANARTASPADHPVVMAVFRDVAPQGTFGEDIEWLAASGITAGCSSDRFCPEDPVTREQMAAFLNRAYDLPTGRTGRFRDVSSSNRFAQDIANLAAGGVTRGCNPPANTRFCPDQPVSREQMAAFLVRAERLSRSSHQGFTDVLRGSTFDADVRRLATAGITRGCNPPANSRFCPDDSVTREQMAAFIRRALT